MYLTCYYDKTRRDERLEKHSEVGRENGEAEAMEPVIRCSAGTTEGYTYEDGNLKVDCQKEKTRFEHSTSRSFDCRTTEGVDIMIDGSCSHS